MIKLELKDNYTTGNYVEIGGCDYTEYISVEELPENFNTDFIAQKCYYSVNDELVFDDEKYVELITNVNQKKVEQAKINKISELKSECNKNITAGIEYCNSRYSYTTEDQLNLKNAVEQAKSTGLDVPYHANGEDYKFFTKAEIMAIYSAEQANLIEQTTYFNQIKKYVETLTDVDSIEKVEYGQALTDEFLDTYNAIICQSNLLTEVSNL